MPAQGSEELKSRYSVELAGIVLRDSSDSYLQSDATFDCVSLVGLNYKIMMYRHFLPLLTANIRAVQSPLYASKQLVQYGVPYRCISNIHPADPPCRDPLVPLNGQGQVGSHFITFLRRLRKVLPVVFLGGQKYDADAKVEL